MQYPINEVFQRLQGEGFYTGVPAIFIRLQGCPVGCRWCDSQYTWHLHQANQTTLDQVVEKSVESEVWASAAALIALLQLISCKVGATRQCIETCLARNGAFPCRSTNT